MVQSIVRRLAERTDVVLLDTGLAFDDHEDFILGASNRVHVVRDALVPRSNLAVQTAIIAGASAYVGTCGALAWLAPMLGVNTTAIFTDARFLHGHLGVARRVYQEMDGAGTFSPLDVSALDALGLVDGLTVPVNHGRGQVSS
jgi:ADP-heptose:LPS heptosyltransferase